jgi:hypothetical protein
MRFSAVFLALLGLSFCSAFLMPGITNPPRRHAQALFSPVSWPVARLGSLIRPAAGAPDRTTAGRTDQQLQVENDELRVENASLRGQVEELLRRERDREELGPLRALCDPFPVSGADSGVRDTLEIVGTTRGLRQNMPVIHPRGLVGQISVAGTLGARVMLVTDPAFRATVSFGRFEQQGNKPVYRKLAIEPRLMRGAGAGEMTVVLTEKEVRAAGLAEEDWVTLSDSSWPIVLKDYRVGRVRRIDKSNDVGFVIVRLAPVDRLFLLREVMVMVRGL